MMAQQKGARRAVKAENRKRKVRRRTAGLTLRNLLKAGSQEAPAERTAPEESGEK